MSRPPARVEAQLPLHLVHEFFGLCLYQTLRAVAKVLDHLLDDRRPTAPANDPRYLLERLGRGEPLLDGHDEEEGRLPVARGPVGSADRGHRWTDAWDAGPDHLVGSASGDRVLSHALHRTHPVMVDDGHVDELVVTARQAGSEQSRDAVESGDAVPDLPDGAPPLCERRQWPGVHSHGLAAVADPPLRPDLGRDVGPPHADVPEEPPRRHAVVVGGDRASRSSAVRSSHLASVGPARRPCRGPRAHPVDRRTLRGGWGRSSRPERVGANRAALPPGVSREPVGNGTVNTSAEVAIGWRA